MHITLLKALEYLGLSVAAIWLAMAFINAEPSYPRLHQIVRQLREGNSRPVEAAVKFVCRSERAGKYNRLRSRMARALKRHNLSDDQKHRLTTSIIAKLEAGDIDGNFMDQLKLVAHIDLDTLRENAKRIELESERQYVIRYAKRALELGSNRRPLPHNNSLQADAPDGPSA